MQHDSRNSPLVFFKPQRHRKKRNS